LIGLGGSEWAEVADLTGAPTPLQMQKWRELGISGTPATRSDARRGIVQARKAMNLASPDMVSFLLKHYPGMEVENVTQKQARAMQMQKLRKWGRVDRSLFAKGLSPAPTHATGLGVEPERRAASAVPAA
jgi:hypothetical protein